MIKPRRIKDVAECTIGQVYLLINKYGSSEAKIVTCKALFADNKMTVDKGGGHESTVELNGRYCSDYIYEYNASLRKRYNKLLEQHKQEIQDLLDGKEVIIYRLSELEQKEKWYKKLWKRLNKKCNK